MRAIRTGLKVIAPLVAVAAFMVAPSMASASPYWGEWSYDPLGAYGGPADPTVSFEVSGQLSFDGPSRDFQCDVIGEAEVYNDFTTAVPAKSRILDLEVADTVSNSCDGTLWDQACPLSDAHFTGFPWSGSGGFVTGFAGVTAWSTFNPSAGCYGMPFAGGASTTAGTLSMRTTTYLGDNGDCVEGFEVVENPTNWELMGGDSPSHVSGTLTIDPETIEGLSTYESGPCFVIAN